MDTSSVLDYSLQYQWCSDSDMSGLSSPSLSPVSSMDSSLSPSDRQQPKPSSQTSSALKPIGVRKVGRARTTRIRSKQRESASEKEKLRMRHLTKALHHLRSYLPPSVAPAGQTLTKIETLRLTIRYISYLSAQLGLSEEVLFQRREQVDMSAHVTSSPEHLSHFQPTPLSSLDSTKVNLNQNLSQDFYSSQPAVMHPGSCSFVMDQYSRQCSEVQHGDVKMDSVFHSTPESKPSYQMFNNGFHLPLLQRDYYA